MNGTTEQDLDDLKNRLEHLEDYLGIYYDDTWGEYRKIEQ